ncbi:MAG: zinc-binding dehydrogenase [Deltaproteobacteria bacterium]|nr:zinc-binding dehydrogenase [Deltaproteobacteria bacterium]
MHSVWLEKSVPRILLALALKRLWPGITLSPLSPIREGEERVDGLPGPGWVRVENRLSGICGTDLHYLQVDVDPMIHGAALPGYERIYLGHEVYSVVTEVGPEVEGLTVGDRVALQKEATCVSQGLAPPCPHCARGNYSLCENQSANVGPHKIGGGFSGEMVVHASQLWRVPDTLGDEAAVLLEPLAVGVRAALRRPPRPGQKVLVIGCGIIGLGLIDALRIVQPEAEVWALARHPHQRAAAEARGARILEGELLEATAEVTGAKLYQGEFGNRTLLGGFDLIHDCVGSARTTQEGLRACRAGGALVMVGLSLSRMKVDLTPVWHQEVDLVGSLIHGVEEWEGERLSTYDLTGRWLAEGRLSTEGLITHRYPRARWREAVRKALAKREGVIKVVLE